MTAVDGSSSNGELVVITPLEEIDEGSYPISLEQEDDPLLSGVRFASLKILEPWFPQANPSHDRAQTFRTWHSRRSVMLTTCSVTATLVFIINCSTLIYLRHVGFAPLFHGSCQSASKISTGLHILLNILSTLLLGASNLCMQLLVSPTRAEIDKAHRSFRWLDIGVPSFRNVSYVRGKCRLAWLLLALSSLPLHFFYNSAIFATLPENSFYWLVVRPDFLTNESFDIKQTDLTLDERSHRQVVGYSKWLNWKFGEGDLGSPGHVSNWWTDDQVALFQYEANSTSEFLKIDRLSCIDRYTTMFGNRSDVILISTGDILNSSPMTASGQNSLLAGGSFSGAFRLAANWLCGVSNDFDCRKKKEWFDRPDMVANWNVYGYKIDYCLIKEKDLSEACEVEISFSVLLIVCIANLFKCIGIYYTLFVYRKADRIPLCTLGDAITSFLNEPDPTTMNMGLASKADFLREGHSWTQPLRKKFDPISHFWRESASRRRCMATFVPLWGVTLLGFFCLAFSLKSCHTQLGSTLAFTQAPFGAISEYGLIAFTSPGSGTAKLYTHIIFANVWQFMLSFLYVQYNALLSCMLVAHEFAGYAHARKTIRVSSPKGIQRSTYFVSMPWRYGVPLISAFSLLHWSLSQSVFVVKVNSYHYSGASDLAASLSLNYFSVPPIILSASTAIVLIMALYLVGRRKYKPGMPLASTCSAAISAAVHQPTPDDQYAAMFPVMWGSLGDTGTHEEGKEQGVGRVTFTTARDVSFPEVGALYE